MYFRMWFRLEAEKEFSVLQLGCRRVRPNRLIRVGRTARQSVEPKSCGLPQRRHCRRRYNLLYCRCRHYRWGNDSVFGIDVNIFCCISHVFLRSKRKLFAVGIRCSVDEQSLFGEFQKDCQSKCCRSEWRTSDSVWYLGSPLPGRQSSQQT